MRILNTISIIFGTRIKNTHNVFENYAIKNINNRIYIEYFTYCCQYCFETNTDLTTSNLVLTQRSKQGDINRYPRLNPALETYIYIFFFFC